MSRTPVRPSGLDLPDMVCLRVSRACNARCGFCLAPPDGHHPSTEVLTERIDWLLDRGVRTVHFCGGEPTLHHGLPALLAHTRARGAKIRLTTNGIRMPEAVLDQLRAGRAEVKVSVHGDRDHHDRVVGRPAYDATVATIRRLVSRRVHTAVQTTVLASSPWSLDAVLRLGLELGVRRVSVMPFIPRGSGRERAEDYGLSEQERRHTKDRVRRARRALAGRLDVRWIDLVAKPFHVVEPDGRLVVEGRSDAFDVALARL